MCKYTHLMPIFLTLVITIIVMLVLAGVSINAIIGDNGIIKNAQTASVAQKVASYKEELEMSIVGVTGEEVAERENVTALNNSVRQYIPSLKDEDIGKYGIIAGELYYLGDDEFENEVAEKQNLKTISENQTYEEFLNDVEDLAVNSIIGDLMSKNPTEEERIGIPLKDKVGNSTDWKLITEISKADGSITRKCGNGYYYIEGGKSSINGLGQVKNGYLINYDTSTIINMDMSENYRYSYMDISSKLGVTKGLVFNLDASSMEAVGVDSQTGKNIYNFGDRVTLRSRLTEDDGNGNQVEKKVYAEDFISNGAFTFDGTNYMEVASGIQGGFDFSQGLTMEFFGKLSTAFYDYSREFEQKCLPFVCARTSSSEGFARFYLEDERYLFFNLGVCRVGQSQSGTYNNPYDLNGVWMEGGKWSHNIHAPISKESLISSNSYMSLVISPDFFVNENNGETDENKISFYIFLDGVKVLHSYLDKRNFDDFVFGSSDVNIFLVGAGVRGDGTRYSVGDIYSFRLYNRALTDDEVFSNYDKTMSNFVGE